MLLSTLPFLKVPLWTEAVTTISAQNTSSMHWLRRLLARFGVPDPSVLWRLIRLAPRAKVVLLNGGERIDLIYLALAGLCPWIRTPHIIVDAHWEPGASALHRVAQRSILFLGKRLLAEVQPHSPEEIPLYESVFGLDPSIVKPLPWSTSLTGYDHVRRTAWPGEAIVTGGHSYRDYPTLLKAVEGTPWPLLIGLPPSPETESVRTRSKSLSNVRLVSDWSFSQYWQEVANSRVFAMAITPGLRRCTADQTLLNAMALGAVVVATNALSSRLYIEHGVTGFLVPEGDVNAWRDTLAHVYSLPAAKTQAIRDRAQHAARTRFSEETRLRTTLTRAHKVALRWNAPDTHAAGAPHPGRFAWAPAALAALLAVKVMALPYFL